MKNELNELINKIIANQKDNTKQKIEFCCGMCSFDTPVNIIETDKIKIIYTDEGKCEVRRKKNSNPVIERSEDQRIYRCHGEWVYLKYELYTLAGLEEEAKELLQSEFEYD